MAEKFGVTEKRLLSQRISCSDCKTPGEIMARLVAIQGQDYYGALWSLALRLPGARVSDIERAIADRQIVRTWLMRGTLHFTSAGDVRGLLRLVAPRILKGSASRNRQLGLNEKIFARCAEIIHKRLKGGHCLTRAELLSSISESGIAVDAARGYHILWNSALEGLICFGPQAGREQTFVLLDEWVPACGAELSAEELAERYFSSRGPATLQDFVWWSGLKITDARAAVGSAGGTLAAEAAGGNTYYSARLPRCGMQNSEMFLLPGFDEFLLAYKDRSASLDPKHAEFVCPGGNGVFKPTMVMDGRVIGIWKRDSRKNTLIPIPFGKFTAGQERAFARAAEKYREYLFLTGL